MFGKLLSSFENVKVDTQLVNPVLQVGEMLNGNVVFQGVSADKHINGLSIELRTRAEVEMGDNEFTEDLTIQRWHLKGNFTLPAHQQIVVPFSVMLPTETPITDVSCHYNKTNVWIYTHLDVDWGLDARDNDYLQVQPNVAMQQFLLAMQQCGFGLYSADVEKGQLRGQNFQSTIGCYQELEFRPIQMMSRINEIEVSFVARENQTHVLLEVDRKFSGHDQYLALSMVHGQTSVEQLVGQIRHLLNI